MNLGGGKAGVPRAGVLRAGLLFVAVGLLRGDAPAPITLVPMFRGSPAEIFTSTRPAAGGPAPVFHAVAAVEWPPGLVPVFAVERDGRVELRRRPRSGHENNTEAVFFALPAADETNATRLAGRWDVAATRGDGSRVRLGWELAVEGDVVAGRFDPMTEYRYAYITGGTERSNRFELRIQNAMDQYEVRGVWVGERLAGEWRRTDEGERGRWEATRPATRPIETGGRSIVALYEWRRASDGSVRYEFEGAALEAGWERAERPLCRVWN